jgi:hypothetical protein
LSVRRISANDPDLTILPHDRAAAVLEAGQDFVSYRRAIGKNDVADPAALAHELLTARSNLNVAAQTSGVPVPKTRPDQGHDSSRVTLGAGIKEGVSFQELQARATYHDILDDDGGYARGAEIEFFSLTMRHYDTVSTRVERFTPVNILSLTPRDDFFQPLSWKIRAGWQRVRAADGSEPLAFSLDGGAGGSWSNKRNTALWYALLDGSSHASRSLADGYALGVGASMGGLFDLGPRWRIHGYARSLRYFLGQQDTTVTTGLEQRYTLGRNSALRADFSHKRELQRTYNSGSVSVLYYF